jgi:DnaK suppressor protein
MRQAPQPALSLRVRARYNSSLISPEPLTQKSKAMEASRLNYFRKRLLAELRQHARQVGVDQAAAIDAADDGAKESADLSLRDVIGEIALRLGERESQIVADIDQALLRIEEGSYGQCVRCNNPIDERRLEALPTARYDAACQAAIEDANGKTARPTL